MYALCNYVCMHVCAMYVYMCVCSVCMCVCIHGCMYVCLCEYMHLFVHAFVCVHTRDHHYLDETEMEHARDLYIDGVSREDIDGISYSWDGD